MDTEVRTWAKTMATKRTKIEQLWHSTDEDDWRRALTEYDTYMNAQVRRLDQEMESLDLDTVRHMDEQEWFDWLHDKYFPWKYTAPNRLATTRGSLNRFVQQKGLRYLFEIKNDLLDAERREIGTCLDIAARTPGLRQAGAAGLLAVLFPEDFGTVDQFVVYALRDISDLPEKNRVLAMRPENLSQDDAVCLIAIFRRQAEELNRRFEIAC